MSEQRRRFLLIGAAIGAILGLAVAWVATDARREEEQLQAQGVQASIQPSAREWVKLAVAAAALLRQVADILTPHRS